MTSVAPSPTTSATQSPPVVKSGSNTVLTASLMGFFVIALDALVVTVALPDISRSVSGGMSGLQWVVDGYTLAFASLMLSAGALSDRIGASRAYGLGLGLFTAASAACGFAPNLTMLIVARLVQGAAASLMMPASLALVRQAFPDAEKRARAIAIWTGAGAVAAAFGPVAGGALTTALSWRAIFFLNLPVGLLGLILLTRAPKSPRQSAPIDLPGQLTGVLALAGLTYGLIEGGASGFGTPRVIVTLVIAALSAIAFAVVESRQEKPMMPLSLFRTRTMSVTAAAGFSINAAFYGSIFVLSLFFQQGHNLSPLSAGLMFLPMTALVAVMNLFFAARIARRFGPRLPIAVGQAGTALALLGLLAVGNSTPEWILALAVLPVAFAGSLSVPALTALLMGSVAPERAGSAAGILNTARQVGGAMSVAVFGALVAHRDTFSSGMRTSLVVSAVLLALTAAASQFLLPRPEKPAVKA
jgi:MFS transporter, DHA2 family, methylenomycin A resistance protein